MRNITANAIFNMKEVPATLYVHGSIMIYHSNERISIKKAIPQGTNPNILILDLKIVEGNGPMKGTTKPFHYKTIKEEAKNYSQVTIRYSMNDSITVDVEKFG